MFYLLDVSHEITWMLTV